MKHLIRFTKLLLFILLFPLIHSCNKDFKGADPEADLTAKIFQSEQALPGLKGEILTTKFNGQTIYVEKKGDRYIWMGDIAFDKQTFDSLCKAEKNTSARTFRSSIIHHWPWGEVNYTIESGFSAAEVTMINNAITHWQANTGLIFNESATASNRIRIVHGSDGSGLYSDFIGMKGGVQVINLESGFITGNVIHEIGHAIGFYHEQCRTDRALFINLFLNRLDDANKAYQYSTYTERGESGLQLGTFDFGSVMLYGSSDNSNGLGPVMTRVDGSTWFGQRFSLSTGDIETANYMYGGPFGRLRYELSDFSSGYDIYRQADVFIDLFADEALTIPATLTIGKSIIIRKEIEQYYGGGWHLSTSEYEVPLLTNVTSVQIEDDMVREDITYDGANIYHGYREDNVYKSGFLRRAN